MDDKELMDRVCAGDRQAFEELVGKHWRTAEHTARDILRDALLAQDVAQDVFADIYVQRLKYVPRFSLAAYVKAIARYKSIDLLRKRDLISKWSEETIAKTQTPEDAVIQKIFQDTLYAAMERLPRQQQQMIKAYALDQLTYREIAAEMHLSVAQVKITLFRIRKRLRRLRDDWEV